MADAPARYLTIAHPGRAKVVEKMSRFLAFALPAATAAEAREAVARLSNVYHDARHVCWAYMLGAARSEWQLNDNGEPSGTAGKPILGQINSLGLTNVVVIVVRYFGGIKLGTPGLIAAYRQAAREALEDAGTAEGCEMTLLRVTFAYPAMNAVMSLVKQLGLTVTERTLDNACALTLSVPADTVDSLRLRLGPEVQTDVLPPQS